MKTINLRSLDQDANQRIEVEDFNVGEGWPEQVELFFQFLNAQGYLLTYGSFLEVFGDKIKDYQECFREVD